MSREKEPKTAKELGRKEKKLMAEKAKMEKERATIEEQLKRKKGLYVAVDCAPEGMSFDQFVLSKPNAAQQPESSEDSDDMTNGKGTLSHDDEARRAAQQAAQATSAEKDTSESSDESEEEEEKNRQPQYQQNTNQQYASNAQSAPWNEPRSLSTITDQNGRVLDFMSQEIRSQERFVILRLDQLVTERAEIINNECTVKRPDGSEYFDLLKAISTWKMGTEDAIMHAMAENCRGTSIFPAIVFKGHPLSEYEIKDGKLYLNGTELSPTIELPKNEKKVTLDAAGEMKDQITLQPKTAEMQDVEQKQAQQVREQTVSMQAEQPEKAAEVYEPSNSDHVENEKMREFHQKQADADLQFYESELNSVEFDSSDKEYGDIKRAQEAAGQRRQVDAVLVNEELPTEELHAEEQPKTTEILADEAHKTEATVVEPVVEQMTAAAVKSVADDLRDIGATQVETNVVDPLMANIGLAAGAAATVAAAGAASMAATAEIKAQPVVETVLENNTAAMPNNTAINLANNDMRMEAVGTQNNAYGVNQEIRNQLFEQIMGAELGKGVKLAFENINGQKIECNISADTLGKMQNVIKTKSQDDADKEIYGMFRAAQGLGAEQRDGLTAAEPVVPGNKRIELVREQESRIVPLGEQESRIVPVGEQESRIVPLDEQERRIVPVDEQERRIVPVGEQESRIVPIGEQESRIVPLSNQNEVKAAELPTIGKDSIVEFYAKPESSKGVSGLLRGKNGMLLMAGKTIDASVVNVLKKAKNPADKIIVTGVSAEAAVEIGLNPNGGNKGAALQVEDKRFDLSDIVPTRQAKKTMQEFLAMREEEKIEIPRAEQKIDLSENIQPEVSEPVAGQKIEAEKAPAAEELHGLSVSLANNAEIEMFKNGTMGKGSRLVVTNRFNQEVSSMEIVAAAVSNRKDRRALQLTVKSNDAEAVNALTDLSRMTAFIEAGDRKVEVSAVDLVKGNAKRAAAIANAQEKLAKEQAAHAKSLDEQKAEAAAVQEQVAEQAVQDNAKSDKNAYFYATLESTKGMDRSALKSGATAQLSANGKNANVKVIDVANGGKQVIMELPVDAMEAVGLKNKGTNKGFSLKIGDNEPVGLKAVNRAANVERMQKIAEAAEQAKVKEETVEVPKASAIEQEIGMSQVAEPEEWITLEKTASPIPSFEKAKLRREEAEVSEPVAEQKIEAEKAPVEYGLSVSLANKDDIELIQNGTIGSGARLVNRDARNREISSMEIVAAATTQRKDMRPVQLTVKSNSEEAVNALTDLSRTTASIEAGDKKVEVSVVDRVRERVRRAVAMVNAQKKLAEEQAARAKSLDEQKAQAAAMQEQVAEQAIQDNAKSDKKAYFYATLEIIKGMDRSALKSGATAQLSANGKNANVKVIAVANGGKRVIMELPIDAMEAVGLKNKGTNKGFSLKIGDNEPVGLKEVNRAANVERMQEIAEAAEQAKVKEETSEVREDVRAENAAVPENRWIELAGKQKREQMKNNLPDSGRIFVSNEGTIEAVDRFNDIFVGNPETKTVENEKAEKTAEQILASVAKQAMPSAREKAIRERDLKAEAERNAKMQPVSEDRWIVPLGKQEAGAERNAEVKPVPEDRRIVPLGSDKKVKFYLTLKNTKGLSKEMFNSDVNLATKDGKKVAGVTKTDAARLKSKDKSVVIELSAKAAAELGIGKGAKAKDLTLQVGGKSVELGRIARVKAKKKVVEEQKSAEAAPEAREDTRIERAEAQGSAESDKLSMNEEMLKKLLSQVKDMDASKGLKFAREGIDGKRTEINVSPETLKAIQDKIRTMPQADAVKEISGMIKTAQGIKAEQRNGLAAVKKDTAKAMDMIRTDTQDVVIEQPEQVVAEPNALQDNMNRFKPADNSASSIDIGTVGSIDIPQDMDLGDKMDAINGAAEQIASAAELQRAQLEIIQNRLANPNLSAEDRVALEEMRRYAMEKVQGLNDAGVSLTEQMNVTIAEQAESSNTEVNEEDEKLQVSGDQNLKAEQEKEEAASEPQENQPETDYFGRFFETLKASKETVVRLREMIRNENGRDVDVTWNLDKKVVDKLNDLPDEIKSGLQNGEEAAYDKFREYMGISEENESQKQAEEAAEQQEKNEQKPAEEVNMAAEQQEENEQKPTYYHLSLRDAENIKDFDFSEDSTVTLSVTKGEQTITAEATITNAAGIRGKEKQIDILIGDQDAKALGLATTSRAKNKAPQGLTLTDGKEKTVTVSGARYAKNLTERERREPLFIGMDVGMASVEAFTRVLMTRAQLEADVGRGRGKDQKTPFTEAFRETVLQIAGSQHQNEDTMKKQEKGMRK